MKSLWIGTATAVLSLTVVPPAVALSVSYNGDLTGAPTFDSPDSGTPPTQTVGGTFPYRVQSFYVGQSGNYDFSSNAIALTTPALSGNPPNWNPTLVLYQNSFNPADPLTNALFSVVPPNITAYSVSRPNFSLTQNTQYYLVTSVFNPDDGYGTFNNTISGATGNDGSITLGEVTPVPFSFSPLPALLLMGIRNLRKVQTRDRSKRQLEKI